MRHHGPDVEQREGEAFGGGGQARRSIGASDNTNFGPVMCEHSCWVNTLWLGVFQRQWNRCITTNDNSI